MKNDQVFFNHTTKHDLVKDGHSPKATIAVALSPDEQSIKYGISICSRMDNFSKVKGREQAQKRLENSFGVIEIPRELKGESQRKKCLTMLYRISASVVMRGRKWKRKVTSYNTSKAESVKSEVVNG